MAQPEFLTVPVSIDKIDVGQTALHHNTCNSAPFMGHAPGTLTFTTFAGSLDKNAKKYVGEYLFMKRGIKDAPQIDFNTLPGLRGIKKGAK